MNDFDTTIIVPISKWRDIELAATLKSVKKFIESSSKEVDCLLVEILPPNTDIELTLFQEIHTLPEYILDLIGTKYFRYMAEVDYTARSLRKILLNCKGENIIILGEGIQIGSSSPRYSESEDFIAKIFPKVSHKSSIRYWSLLYKIRTLVPSITSVCCISLANISQILFKREKVVSVLRKNDPYERDDNNFERIIKHAILALSLSGSSSIEVATSSAILDEHGLCVIQPLDVNELRPKLYSSYVDASDELKVALDFTIDFISKSFTNHHLIDWSYPAKHYDIHSSPTGINIFSKLISTLAFSSSVGEKDSYCAIQLLSNTLVDLNNFYDQKSQPNQRIKTSVISSLFREKDMIGGFLSNITRLEGFNEDHELILVLPGVDISQGLLTDFYHILHPNIRVIQLNNDPGIYECWNIAIRSARGTFITNANCDDRRLPRHTRKIVKVLEETDADIGSTAIIAIESTEIINDCHDPRKLEDLKSAGTLWYCHGSDNLVEYKELKDFFLYNNNNEVIQCYNFLHCMPVWRRQIHEDIGYFSESQYGTYSDYAFWLNAARSGKRIIHISEALGIYTIRENSHNRRNSDADKWLGIITEAVPSANIKAFSEHIRAQSIENNVATDNSIEVVSSLDFGNQISQNYGNHRAGWGWVASQLSHRHSSSSPIYCDLFLEKKFVWGNDEYDACHSSAKPFQKPWIGFLHVPPSVPSFFQYEQSNQQLFRSSMFKESLHLCRSIIALTKYHADFLRDVFKNTKVQIFSLHHPTEIPHPKDWFSFEKFYHCSPKQLVQVGWWLRKLNAINYLSLSKIDYSPIMLGNCDWNKALISYAERRYHSLTKPFNAEIIPFLNNEDYDQLVSSSIVFVDFYDTSANNAVIECIARRTPILVPKHPAIREYLGDDYPFYFDRFEDVEFLLRDDLRLHEAHQYLGQKEIQEKIDIHAFITSFDKIIEKLSGG